MNCNNKIYKYLHPIIFSCIIIAVHAQTTPSPPPPNANLSYILSCGATNDTTDVNGRKWAPDAKFFKSNDSSLATAQAQDPSLPSTVPYMTARLFKSQATYNFPVPPNSRHWIRLHFYPTPYDNFDPTNSFLKVTASGVTLLNNFSAHITADALTLAYIVREFTITKVDSDSLALTFTPCGNASVFINGIEVIPMPEIFGQASMVGVGDEPVNLDLSEYSMETMARLNVGGQYIAENSGNHSRTWYDDSPYIYGSAYGWTVQANDTISYPSKEAEDVAPVEVYRTMRSMGGDKGVSKNFNLTWTFEVDVNFTYLVRLHLCDFLHDKANEMAFDVFINNQTAETVIDLLAFTGRKGEAVFKDYTTYMNGRNNNSNIWLALHPSMSSKPEFYDAVLNGVEIFKLTDTKMNLAGPNPVPSTMKLRNAHSSPASFASPPENSNRGMIIGSVGGTVAAFGVVAWLVFFVSRKRKENKGFSSSFGGWLPIYGSSRSTEMTGTTKTGGSSRISNLGGGLCRHFSLAELKLGTNNFSESRVIGVGGFGKVYKGYIDGNSMTVAIKRANPSSDQGVHEFLNEIELLSKLRHRHLVSLIGACEENNEMILVYDYMANGTLREHLYKNNINPPLSWEQRLAICIGASRGIHYLHTGAKYTIIHRDVKSTNILLDEKWVGKVSDFGLSKTGPTMNQSHVSTVVKGSFGYLDPEYFRRQQLTEKSDVYSFGVVLFEVLCGRPALNPHLSKEQVSLADWAIINNRKGTLGDIVDPNIKGQISPTCLKYFSDTAVKCLSDHGLERPAMGDVLWNLEYCLQLQTNPDGPKVEAKQKANNAYAMHATLLGIVEEEEGGEGEKGDKSGKVEEHSGNAAFSQIVNPTGR